MSLIDPQLRPLAVLRVSALRVLALAMLSVALPSCGPPPEVPPGTTGIVRSDGMPLADVLVQIYSDPPAAEPLGVGISDSAGHFQLRLPDLAGPLHVEPGDYRFTIESAGEFYLSWPAELRDPQKTPLLQSIADPQQIIELNVPTPR